MPAPVSAAVAWTSAAATESGFSGKVLFDILAVDLDSLSVAFERNLQVAGIFLMLFGFVRLAGALQAPEFFQLEEIGVTVLVNQRVSLAAGGHAARGIGN